MSSHVDIDTDSDESSASGDAIYDLAALGVGLAAEYFLKYVDKTPVRTSPRSGFQFIHEILQGHDIRCHEQFRMEKHVFHLFCDSLRRYGLERTRSTPVEEMIGLFLMIFGHGLGNRMNQELFQHSGETISRHFYRVLECACKMAIDWIKPVDLEYREVPAFMSEDRRYWPYFKDCIGAIDGTLVPCVVSNEIQAAYIGRKGYTCQNIMASCDFNMCFTFALAGWEGTAHDTRIFLAALRRPNLNFPHPPLGKYYLVDAGYPMPWGYIGPYKGERYHLPDFQRNRQFNSANEKFNYYHSSLRGIIERTFGVWKNRFKIICTMSSYSYDTQVRIVIISMAIHNFIRRHAHTDFDAEQYDRDQAQLRQHDEESSNALSQVPSTFESCSEMELLRDGIRDAIASSL